MSFHHNIVFFYYFIVHLCRISIVFCHKNLTPYFEKYKKKEQTDDYWIEEYSIWSEPEINDFGFLDDHFIYEELYIHQNNTPQNEYSLYKQKSRFKKDNYSSIFIAKQSSSVYIVLTPQTSQYISDVQKSYICFVYVEYNHPKMNHSIELNIPSSYFIVGNTLLTSAFVLRFLQLLNVYYVFDTDYTLRILDHELNEKQLDFWESVEIQENTYIIK